MKFLRSGRDWVCLAIRDAGGVTALLAGELLRSVLLLFSGLQSSHDLRVAAACMGFVIHRFLWRVQEHA